MSINSPPGSTPNSALSNVSGVSANPPPVCEPIDRTASSSGAVRSANSATSPVRPVPGLRVAGKSYSSAVSGLPTPVLSLAALDALSGPPATERSLFSPSRSPERGRGSAAAKSKPKSDQAVDELREARRGPIPSRPSRTQLEREASSAGRAAPSPARSSNHATSGSRLEGLSDRPVDFVRNRGLQVESPRTGWDPHAKQPANSGRDSGKHRSGGKPSDVAPRSDAGHLPAKRGDGRAKALTGRKAGTRGGADQRAVGVAVRDLDAQIAGAIDAVREARADQRAGADHAALVAAGPAEVAGHPGAVGADQAQAAQPERRPRIVLQYTVSDRTKVILKSLAPGYELEERPGAHPHPISAFTRRRLEEEMRDYLCPILRNMSPDSYIVDVGGNPDRGTQLWRSTRHPYTAMCPVLEARDVCRRTKFASTPGIAPYCDHVLSDSTDLNSRACRCQRPFIYVSNDVLYYLVVEDILAACLKAESGIFMACVLRFNGARGTLNNGECRYTSFETVRHGRRERMIKMWTKGNGAPYVNPACDWLRESSSMPLRDGYKLVWTIVRSVGSADCYMFQITRQPLPLEPRVGGGYEYTPEPGAPLQFSAAVADPEFCGKVVFRTHANALNSEAGTVTDTAEMYLEEKIAVSSAYGHFMLSPIPTALGDQRPIFVPKKLVGEVALRIVGKRRDRDTYMVALEAARKYAGQVDADPIEIARSVPHIAALAFLLTLDEEIAAHRRIADKSHVLDLQRMLFDTQPGEWLSNVWWNTPYRYKRLLIHVILPVLLVTVLWLFGRHIPGPIGWVFGAMHRGSLFGSMWNPFASVPEPAKRWFWEYWENPWIDVRPPQLSYWGQISEAYSSASASVPHWWDAAKSWRETVPLLSYDYWFPMSAALGRPTFVGLYFDVWTKLTTGLHYTQHWTAVATTCVQEVLDLTSGVPASVHAWWMRTSPKMIPEAPVEMRPMFDTMHNFSHDRCAVSFSDSVPALFVAPILEEILKHLPVVGPFVTLYIVLWESFTKLFFLRSPLITLTNLLMHLVAAYLPWQQGMMLHAANNWILFISMWLHPWQCKVYGSMLDAWGMFGLSCVIFLLVAAICWRSITKWKCAILDHPLVPIVEEFIKHTPLGLPMVAAEAAMKWKNHGPASAFVSVAAHVAFSALPLPIACVAHIAWNESMPNLIHGITQYDVCFKGAVPFKELHAALDDKDTDARVVKVAPRRPCVPKVATTCLGPALKRSKPVVGRHCQHNEELSLRNRVLFQTYEDPDMFQELRSTVNDMQKIKLLVIDEVVEPPMAQFLARFPKANRDRLSKHLRLYGRGRGHTKTRTKAFLKWEHLVKAGLGGICPIVPRFIQGKEDDYLLDVGPTMWAIGNRLKTLWHKNAQIYYTSGATAEDLGQWFDECCRIFDTALENDAELWDASTRRLALQLELDTYARFFTRDEQVLRCLKAQQRARGQTPNGCFFWGPGMRESGVPNTSCGNSLLNGIFTFDLARRGCLALGLPCDKSTFRCALLGDDNIMFGKRELIEWMYANGVAHFARCGYTAKLVIRKDPRLSEYCSGRFYPSESGSVWAPKIGRALSKMCWRIRTADNSPDQNWLSGIAVGYTLDASHVPILRSVATSLGTYWGNYSPAVIREQRNRAKRAHEVTQQTWEMMADLYGLTRSEIEEVERRIESAPPGAFFVDSYVTDRLCAVDCPLKPDLPGLIPMPWKSRAAYECNVVKQLVLGFFDQTCRREPRLGDDIFASRRNLSQLIHHGVSLFSTMQRAPQAKGQAKPKSKRGPRSRAKPKAAAARIEARSIAKLGTAVRQLDRKVKVSAVSIADQRARALALEIARSITAPVSFPALRLQDGFNTKPTALAEPFSVVQGTPSAGDAGTTDATGVPASTQIAVCFRDARRSLVVFDPNSGGKTGSYQAVIDGNSTFSAANGAMIDIDSWSPSAGAWKYHGNKLFMARGPAMSNELTNTTRYTPLTSQQQLVVTGVTITSATTCTLLLCVGDDVRRYQKTVTSSGAGVATYNISDFLDDNGSSPPACGYYVVSFDSAITDGTLVMSAAGPVWCHLSLANFENEQPTWETMRFDALGFMWSNSSAVLAREGVAVGCQIPKDRDYVEIAYDGFSKFEILAQAKRFDAREGIYGWYRPSNISDFKFHNVGNVRFEQSPDTYPVVPTSDYLMIMSDIPDAPARTGYWSVFTAVEGLTDSSWKDAATPSHSKQHFEMALDLTIKCDQWHPNKSHISQIVSFFKNKRKQIGNTLGLIGEKFPQASPFTKILDSVLDWA